MTDQLYSAEEAAKVLGLGVRTVRNYVREGRLAGVRIGKQYRIARADLEAFTGADAAAGQTLRSSGPVQATSAVEVSAVIEIDAIDAEASSQLERTLVAACNSGLGERQQPLRIEPIYDSERRRLRVIVVGSPTDTVAVLRLVDRLTVGNR